ncbi:MAG TPA: hypothetical protein DCS93_01280 [Microscillaceae bacterium]|nr:hypothetical protein [Microscillaceae bacterium]
MYQQLLKIQLLLNTDDFYPEEHYKLIASAQNIQLEPYSTSTLRKFYLQNIAPLTDDFLLQGGDEIRIEIQFYNKPQDSFNYTDIIEMRLYKVEYSNNDQWVLEGTITYDPIYHQGVIETYDHWQNGKLLKWYGLPQEISTLEYIHACMNYTSISTVTPEKTVFEIDFNLIKSELDIACAFAEAFFGERSYMGRYLDTLDDCLLTLYHKRGYFEDKTILLKNVQSPLLPEVAKVLPELRQILQKYKFQVIDQ